ncbi:MAG TPA: hypothetical protein VGW78_02915 [Candidatus Babeliales bacterium]|jgi:hypothetical protein|nr:hypothetical protein [Candidatus Babeliales bacterium]
MKNFYFLYIVSFCLQVHAMQLSDFESWQEEIEHYHNKAEESCLMNNHITHIPIERINGQILNNSEYALLHDMQTKNDTKSLCTLLPFIPKELIKDIIVNDIGEGDILLWEEFRKDPYGRAMVKLSNAIQSQQKLNKQTFPLSLLYKTPTSLQQLYGRLIPAWVDGKVPNISLEDEYTIIQYMPKSLLKDIGELQVMCQKSPSITEALDNGVQCASIGFTSALSVVGVVGPVITKIYSNTDILKNKCPSTLSYALGIPALVQPCITDGLDYLISKAQNKPLCDMNQRKGHYILQTITGLALTSALYRFTGSPSGNKLSQEVLWSVPFGAAGACYGIRSSLATKKYTDKRTIREIKKTRIIQ